MTDHFVFGLGVRSAIMLKELPARTLTRAPDLEVVDAGRTRAQDELSDDALISNTPDAVEMRFPGVGRFILRPSERRILVLTEPGGEDLVSLPLLGPVIGVYLHLRERLVLHASAVVVDARALVFVGDKGAGKSTTAAAFVEGSASLLTDDLLVCSDGVTPARCERGLSLIKLNTDAAAALPLTAGERMASPHPSFAKTLIQLADGGTAPVPIGALCVLERGAALHLRRLAPSEALGAVLRFTYVARYGAEFLSQQHGAAHFRRAAAFVAGTPVWSLTLPPIDDLSQAVTGVVSRLLEARTPP